MKIINWFINIFTFSKKGKLKKIKQLSERSDVDPETGETLVQAMQTQFQRDPHELIMQKSQDHLNDLKIYVNYFSEEELLEKAFVQSQVIHDVFAENKELNYKSLEQFHYYYTVHLIDVLKQLKKKYDEKNLIFRSKIKALKEVVAKSEEKVKKITVDQKKVSNHKYQYASFMTLLLTSIYNCIVKNFEDFRFKNKTQLQKLTYTFNNGLDYAWEIPQELFKQLTELLTDDDVDEKGVKRGAPYRYNGYIIERPLLGRLNRDHYHVSFIGTFKMDGQSDFFEVFQISDSDKYFLIHAEYGLIRSVDIKILSQYMADKTTRVGQINEDINEHEQQIRELNFKMKENPVFNTEIKETLTKYIETISKQELMTDFTQVDLHRQNLEAIMKLERMVI